MTVYKSFDILKDFHEKINQNISLQEVTILKKGLAVLPSKFKYMFFGRICYRKHKTALCYNMFHGYNYIKHPADVPLFDNFGTK